MGSSGQRKGKAPAFPENEAPGFFKIVLAKALTDDEIEIPKMAVMEYDDYMADHLVLEVLDGREWQVKLTRRDGEVWLREGWPQFAKFYSLENECLLWFVYEGNHSHFQVHIFRQNSLEMEYSSNGEAEGNFVSSETETPRMRKCGGDGGMSSAQKSTEASGTGAKAKYEEAKERTYAKASSFKSDKPFLVITM